MVGHMGLQILPPVLSTREVNDMMVTRTNSAPIGHLSLSLCGSVQLGI
jgi:hypothetical protein